MLSFSKTPGKVNYIVMNFVRILLVLSLITTYLKGRTLITIFLGITLLATYIPHIMKHFFNIETRAESQIVMLIFIYGVLFLSEVRGLFANYWWWDVLLTFSASIVLGFIGFTVIYSLYQERVIDTSPFMVVFLAFSISFAIGSLWEIFSFAMDRYLGFNLQQLGTGDIIKNLSIYASGALLVSFSSFIFMKYYRSNLLSSLILKFMKRNPKLFKSKKSLETPSEEISNLIKKGESPTIEFKSTLRTNLHTGNKDKNIELTVLKTLVAYLNTNGGTVLVGVSDSGSVLGLEKDSFENNDKLKLHLTNLIKHHIGRQFFPFIDYELFPIGDRHVLKITCLPSNKRVFLKSGKDEDFFVRSGPSTSKLSGPALIDYINHHFKG